MTAADLALREDICYQIFGDVGSLIRGERVDEGISLV